MFRKKERAGDVLAFADMLAAVDLPSDYKVSGQRYHDFRAVLVDGTGSVGQARRVLTQIFKWGGLFTPVHQEGDPYGTHARAGAQEVCQRILMAINTIPKTEEEETDG